MVGAPRTQELLERPCFEAGPANRSTDGGTAEMIVVLAASAPVFEDPREHLEYANDYRVAVRKRLKARESRPEKAMHA